MKHRVVIDEDPTVTYPAPGKVRMTVEGPLDILSAPRLRDLTIEALSTHEPSVLEFDPAATSEIDALGHGVLPGAYRRSEYVCAKW